MATQPHKCVTVSHAFRPPTDGHAHLWNEDHRHDGQGLVIERCGCSAMRFSWPRDREYILVGYTGPRTFGLMGNVERRKFEAQQIVGEMRAQMDGRGAKKTHDTMPWKAT